MRQIDIAETTPLLIVLLQFIDVLTIGHLIIQLDCNNKYSTMDNGNESITITATDI